MKSPLTPQRYLFASIALSLAACAGNRPAAKPPVSAPPSHAEAASPAPVAPVAPAQQPTPPVPPTPTVSPAAAPPSADRASTTTAGTPNVAAVKPAPVTGKRPVPASAANPATKPKAASAPPVAAAKPVATLNLTDLEQRLRDTKAIGVFTKLSLKNQVDDLLGDFRTLYKEQRKEPPAEFRARYDSLLAKVLSLLQGGDPQLAQSIASSREAIWGILSDPEKFSKI